MAAKSNGRATLLTLYMRLKSKYFSTGSVERVLLAVTNHQSDLPVDMGNFIILEFIQLNEALARASTIKLTACVIRERGAID